MGKHDDQQERSEEFERFERLAKAVLKVKKSDIVRHGTITNTLKRELDVEKVPEPKPPRKRKEPKGGSSSGR